MTAAPYDDRGRDCSLTSASTDATVGRLAIAIAVNLWSRVEFALDSHTVSHCLPDITAPVNMEVRVLSQPITPFLLMQC